MNGQLKGLDGARGMAALAVVASHLADRGYLPSLFGHGLGQIGVMVFYCLSGFLMSYLYIDQEFSRPAVKKYLLNRLYRIAPLFYAVIAASLCFSCFGLANPFEIGSMKDLLSSLLLVRGSGVLWSIPVEIHFYALFVIFWLGHSLKLLAPALAIFSLIQLAAIVSLGADVDTSYLPFWAHFFIFGCVVGVLYRNYHRKFELLIRSQTAQIIAWAVFAMSPLILPELRRLLNIPTFLPFMDPIGVSMVFAVFLLSLAEIGPFKLLCATPVVWIGKISFGIYLYHMFFLELAKEISVDLPFVHAMFVVTAATATAALSYRFYEFPLQRWLKARDPSSGKPETRHLGEAPRRIARR